MGNSLRTKETVVQGESEGKSFYEIMEASETFGWQTFDRVVVNAYDQGHITEETALLYCTKRGVVTRMLDNLKKVRGEAAADFSDLRMRNTVDVPIANGGAGAPKPVSNGLKLK